MILWRKFVPANPKPSIWVSNKIRKREDTQKKVVYLGNEGNDSDDTTEQGSVSLLFSTSMSLGVS